MRSHNPFGVVQVRPYLSDTYYSVCKNSQVLCVRGDSFDLARKDSVA